jgi:hypothetical protein
MAAPLTSLSVDFRYPLLFILRPLPSLRLLLRWILTLEWNCALPHPFPQTLANFFRRDRGVLSKRRPSDPL